MYVYKPYVSVVVDYNCYKSSVLVHADIPTSCRTLLGTLMFTNSMPIEVDKQYKYLINGKEVTNLDTNIEEGDVITILFDDKQVALGLPAS